MDACECADRAEGDGEIGLARVEVVEVDGAGCFERRAQFVAPEMTAAEIHDGFPELVQNNRYFRTLLQVLDENENQSTGYSTRRCALIAAYRTNRVGRHPVRSRRR